MANYDVTFETDWDTSTNGRRGSRRFDVEARSPREAAMLGYDKLMVLSGQGYVRVDDVQGVRGEVERNTFGVRRGGYNPRWSLLVKQGTGARFSLEFILEKVE